MASAPYRFGMLALAGAYLMLAACTAGAATPTSSGGTSTEPSASTAVPPTAVPPTAGPPTAVARPTLPTVSATSAPAAASQSTAAAQPTTVAQPAATADALKLTIDPTSSQASYHAREQLVGNSLPSDAVGTSKAVSGRLVLSADGSVIADQSQITVDLTKLQSDESRRDNVVKNNTLQTSQYPTAVFVPRAAPGLPTPLPTSGEATFQLDGDLTVHGVTKPATWQVAAQFGDSSVSGSATTSVNITDFGMTPPRIGPVLSIEDGLKLELAFTAAREA